MARRERLLAALVPVVTVLWLSGGPGRAAALIEPRLDRPRWWVPPSNPGDGHRFPAEPKVAQHRPQKDEPARGVLPAYIVSEHTVGPKPPPGYSFSAGPKPARFPKPAQQDEEEEEEEDEEAEEEASPAPPPTTPEVTVVDNSLKHLWPKSGRRYGGARPRSGSR
ncbi:hypothetical protein FJT64_017929 [Amphibalanus amphitrite]|uniref:Uncharacterized protein n=1 Tax=Amphibalanus amphitrite TaxID=1232801 RepID=A0A6A4WWI8_AMPAM|nr:hypothetical protein FJT64_017929 [Amphibalanus amphitrite]